MLIVFLLFCFFMFVFFLKIRINIEFINISNINDFKKLKYDYMIKLGLYLTKKINLINININREKVDNKQIISKIKKSLNRDNGNFNKFKQEKIIKYLLNMKYNFEKFNLNIIISAENSIATSLITAILSSLVGFFMANYIEKYNPDKHKFIVTPVYKDEIIIDIKFNSIIYLDLVHIIYMLFKLRGISKNERTSNRRSYDHSYE